MGLFKKKLTVDNMLTIEYLKTHKAKLKNNVTLDRKNTKVLVIDDEGYDCDPLKRAGYVNIKVEYSYTDIRDYEIYDVILCDINGIAKELNEKYQGAALAKLIKVTYPNKIVIILSAKQQYVDFNEYYKYVDDTIPKNIQPSDLAEKLDEYIKDIYDPVKYWENTRLRLVNEGVCTKVISELEHFYVKSLTENGDYISDFNRIKTELSLSDVIAIVDGIIGIISIFTGK